jgi:hypothetical protein
MDEFLWARLGDNRRRAGKACFLVLRHRLRLPGKGRVGRAEAWANARGMHWSCASDGATPNGVAIPSKTPFNCISTTPEREVAGTILRAAFGGWTLLACYFPKKKAKAGYFDVCRDEARACSEPPFLLLGDLNTGNQVADRTPDGDRYVCADRFDNFRRAKA